MGDAVRPRAGAQPGEPSRAAGLTARYYNSDLPFSAVWGPRGVPWTRPVADYYADCSAGTLPSIAFVDPPFRDGGGGDGISADEHPLGDVRLGQAFMSDVVHAFIESPNWERGALFIVYDEWGGFFDDVRPPERGRRTAQLEHRPRLRANGLPHSARRRLAFTRRRGAVNHLLCGFESIIKLITYRFCARRPHDPGCPGEQHRAEHELDAAEPRAARPSRSGAHRLGPMHCRRAGTCSTANRRMRAISRNWRSLAERFGFPTGSGIRERIFREPDSVQQALA